MTLDELEAEYLRACDEAVRDAIQGAVEAFPEVGEQLSEQNCTCVMVLDDGIVNIGLDCGAQTAEEAAFQERLQDSLYALSTITLVNAMANKDRDAYEGCYVEWPLIRDQAEGTSRQ